ncbi:hypothetical protein PMAYCL1PPCAC_17670, partial [Pristionchus mayeri]
PVKRGYLAPQEEIEKERRKLALLLGYEYKEEKKVGEKRINQVFEGIPAGSIVNLKEKKVFTPTDSWFPCNSLDRLSDPLLTLPSFSPFLLPFLYPAILAHSESEAAFWSQSFHSIEGSSMGSSLTTSRTSSTSSSPRAPPRSAISSTVLFLRSFANRFADIRLTKLGTLGCDEVLLKGRELDEEREGALGFRASRFEVEGDWPGEAIA